MKKNLEKFFSPTLGALTLEKVVDEVVNFFADAPEFSYKITIGTDSKKYKKKNIFVTVILIHRIGKGGKYFFIKRIDNNVYSLKHRILKEALYSLDLAKEFSYKFSKKLNLISSKNIKFEIHIDIGQNGATKDMIKELIGMISTNGFLAKIKPESYCASFVADRHT